MIKNIDVSVNNQSIHGYIENPGQDAVVILCHGFGANLEGPTGGAFDTLSEKLIEHNFSVLRFNFRGVLPSEGHPNDLSVKTETHDLETIIEHVRAEGYQKVICLGESFGGTIIVNAYKNNMDAIILWYTPLELKDTVWREILNRRFSDELKDKGYIIDSGTRIGPTLYKEIASLDLYKKGKEIIAPILILHGDADKTVPSSQSEKFFDLLPQVKKLGIINGANHGFAHHQDEVIEQTMEFILNEI